MLSDYKRRLSPLQMEQMIIHLKSEMEKYRNKNEKYEKELRKNGKEKNSVLVEKIEQLQHELLEQRGESMMLKNWKDTIQNELTTYKDSLEEFKKMIELERQKGSEREERNKELEREIDALSEIMREFTTNQTQLQREYGILEKEMAQLAHPKVKQDFHEELLEYKQLIEKVEADQEKKSEELKQLQLQMTGKENNDLLLNEALTLQKQEQNKLNEEIDNLKNLLKKEEENKAHLNEVVTKMNSKATEKTGVQHGFHFSHDELKGKFSKGMNTQKTGSHSETKLSYNQLLSTNTGTSLLGAKKTSPSSKNSFQHLKKSNPSRKETSFGLNPIESQTTGSTVNPFRNIGK